MIDALQSLRLARNVLFAAVLMTEGTGTARAGSCPDVIGQADLDVAAEIVETLYATPEFADARTWMTPDEIRDLTPVLTDALAGMLLRHSAAVAAADRAGDALVKSPFPEGPIFLSNYEGMDGFDVAGARVGDDEAILVTVHMTYAGPAGSTAWSDVAVLRCQSDAWRLDDILFDPTQTAGPSLRDRVSVP